MDFVVVGLGRERLGAEVEDVDVEAEAVGEAGLGFGGDGGFVCGSRSVADAVVGFVGRGGEAVAVRFWGN